MTARSQQPGERHDQVDEQDGQVTHDPRLPSAKIDKSSILKRFWL